MRPLAKPLKGALLAAAICASAARAQTAPQLVPDLRTRNIQIDYYAPRACPTAVPGLGGGRSGSAPCADYDARYKAMQQRQVLEQVGQFLAPIKWPSVLRLIMKQCAASGVPTPAVFYNPTEYSLTICYQFFSDLQLAAATTGPGGRNASFATSQEVIVGALVGTVLHEVARAAFDMLRIPVLGSDDDAADQLAGLIGLQFGPDVARAVIKGTYLLWTTYDVVGRSKNLPYSFANRASVNPQRADNFLCIGFGGQPAVFQEFIDKGLLPQSRAVHCADEYRQAADAFDKTIKPRIDADLMNKAMSITWITSDDLK